MPGIDGEVSAELGEALAHAEKANPKPGITLRRWRLHAMTVVADFQEERTIHGLNLHLCRARAGMAVKLPALESRFRDIYSKLLAKHDLQVMGYWVPEGSTNWDNTFVYLVAHSSREEAKKNWDAMLADPEVQEAIKSEQANKLVEKIDRTYMRSTDFSPMK